MKRRRWSVTKRDPEMDQEVMAWTEAQLRAPRGVAFVPATIPRRPVRSAVRPVLRARRQQLIGPSLVPFALKRAAEDTTWVVEAHTKTKITVVHGDEGGDQGVDEESGGESVDASHNTEPSTRRRAASWTYTMRPCYVDATTSAWFDVPARVEPVHRRAWTEVYRPHGLGDVIGNASAKSALVEWYKQHDKPCLLSGPVGVGKTAAAHALLESAGYEVVDSNDPAIVEHTLMRKLVPNELPIGLIIDEIDTTESNARTQLIKLVKAKVSQAQKTKLPLLPIVFVCENASDRSLVALRGVCKVVRMVREPGSVKVLLEKLARAEQVPRALCSPIEQVCNGDLRRATLLLELTSKDVNGVFHTSGSLFQNDLFFATPFDAASELLSGRSTSDLIPLVDAVRSEGDIVPMLVHENYVQCEKGGGVEDVCKLSEILSDCDLMDNHPSYQLGLTAATVLVGSTRQYMSSSTVVRCKSVAFTSYFPHLSTRRASHDLMLSLNEACKWGHLDAVDWRMLRDVAREKECGKWLLNELPESSHAEFKKFVRSNQE